VALARGRRTDRRIDYWPGFVDALSTLLLAIMFLLTVFVLAQFLLGRELSGKDTVLNRLNSQINELTQLVALERSNSQDNEDALNVSETRDRDSNTKIADLGRRLNVALAQRVQELNRYRSDFFGRLREILADRENIRIVGDRFVFQSEVLFPTGSEVINDAGKVEMKKLADAIIELQKEIPPEINWVLRVD